MAEDMVAIPVWVGGGSFNFNSILEKADKTAKTPAKGIHVPRHNNGFIDTLSEASVAVSLCRAQGEKCDLQAMQALFDYARVNRSSLVEVIDEKIDYVRVSTESADQKANDFCELAREITAASKELSPQERHDLFYSILHINIDILELGKENKKKVTACLVVEKAKSGDYEKALQDLSIWVNVNDQGNVLSQIRQAILTNYDRNELDAAQKERLLRKIDDLKSLGSEKK